MRLGNVLLLLMLAPIASGCASLPPLHQAAVQPSAQRRCAMPNRRRREAWAIQSRHMAYGEPTSYRRTARPQGIDPVFGVGCSVRAPPARCTSAGMVVEAPPGPLVIPPAQMQLPTPKGMIAAAAPATVAAAVPVRRACAGRAPRLDRDGQCAAPGRGRPAGSEIDGPYTVDTGDRLRIVVFGQEGLSNSYVVDAQGNLSLPLIGTIAARAQTTEELSRIIADRLRKGFIREPHVSIEVESYRPFFILGEVIAPGQYPYVPQHDGGDRGRDRRRLHPARLSLGDPISTAAPAAARCATSVPPLAHIRPGDTITVKERWF